MSQKISAEDYPNTYVAFCNWFRREGWGANSIDELSDEGWDEWFPDFLNDSGVCNADEFENQYECE